MPKFHQFKEKLFHVWETEFTSIIFLIIPVTLSASLIGWRPGQLPGWPTPYFGPEVRL